MVTNNTKTQTQRKHHIRTHSNSEEGGKDLNVLVTHLDGPDSGFASSIALLVPTGKWYWVWCVDTLWMENHRQPGPRLPGTQGFRRTGKTQFRGGMIKLLFCIWQSKHHSTSVFWCQRENKKIWPLNISPKSSSILQKCPSFQPPRRGSLEIIHTPFREAFPTQGHQVAVVFQHHTPVQVPLSWDQQLPFFPSKVHKHNHEWQWSLKKHIYIQSQIILLSLE